MELVNSVLNLVISLGILVSVIKLNKNIDKLKKIKLFKKFNFVCLVEF